MQGGGGCSQSATVTMDRVAVSQYADSSSNSDDDEPVSETDSDAAPSGGRQCTANAHAAVAGVVKVRLPEP